MGGVGWDSGFDSCYRVGLWSGVMRSLTGVIGDACIGGGCSRWICCVATQRVDSSPVGIFDSTYRN